MAATPTPAPAKPEKGGGGFFKKLGKHLKDKVGEVASQTTENLASSANQVVDATAQTGSNLVSGATAQASSTARSAVGGVASGILPFKGTADNLSTTLDQGTAEFRNKLFNSSAVVLEPAGTDLVERLAIELRLPKRSSNRFEIQVHVDPMPDALNTSMARAALFKDNLLKRGVDPARFQAVGYGALVYKPDVPPDAAPGTPPSSERVVIQRIQ
ncbi:MAG: hypothetical protein ACJ8BF_06575 [Gemmatimonadales bacterium]